MVEASSAWRAGQRRMVLSPAVRRLGTSEAVWVLSCLLGGMALRLWTFGWFPLREDEALYGYWARLIASGRDVMLERVAVDKPPLFLYSLAQFFTWFGPSEASGRWLNELCSLLALILLWLLARRLYGARTARLALALFALSPFAIAFAPTMYTDPMLMAWLLLALLAATLRPPRAWGKTSAQAAAWRLGFSLLAGAGAGLALGMAFDTKQNALLFIPLIAGALVIAGIEDRIQDKVGNTPAPSRLLTSSLPRLILSLLAAAAGFYFIWFKIWQWDSWRILPAEIPSFWEQAWRTYGGLGWIPVQDWGARLIAWMQVGRWLGGWWGGTMALVGLASLAALDTLHTSHLTPRVSRFTFHGSRPFLWSCLFLTFTFIYLLTHVIFSFQPWDRYLLPLAPLLALLAARGLVLLWRWANTLTLPRSLLPTSSSLLLAALVWGAGQATLSRIPVGGDHGAWGGIEAVAAYLQEAVPADHGVLYQRWEGWHWNWYLWEGPHGRVYWANPQMLVDELKTNPTGYKRFVVFPGWHEDERPPLQKALAPYRLRLAPRLIVRDPNAGSVHFTVYQIVPETGE